MSRIQLGLGQRLSDWIRKFQQARSLEQRVASLNDLKLRDVRLYIPSITNRTTGMQEPIGLSGVQTVPKTLQ